MSQSLPPLQPIHPETHKYNQGRILCIGGSIGMSGAVLLMVQAALRTGAGMVYAAVPGGLTTIMELGCHESITIPCGDTSCANLNESHYELLMNQSADVVVIGPGLGRDASTMRLVRKIVKTCPAPLVIDADALWALSQKPHHLAKHVAPVILTPHLMEFSRLMNCAPGAIEGYREKLLRTYATKFNLTVLLKGATTIISNGTDVFHNTTGNPGLATAGSGDVLTGIIATLVAQGIPPFEAASMGAHIHGSAGDCAAKILGERSLLAGDIISYIPEALQNYNPPTLQP